MSDNAKKKTSSKTSSKGAKPSAAQQAKQERVEAGKPVAASGLTSVPNSDLNPAFSHPSE